LNWLTSADPPMLRLTNLKLPLDHDQAALPAAIIARLGIAAGELLGFTIAQRSYDARKRRAITLIYAVDVETTREADILARLQVDDEAVDGKLGLTPDTTYKPVATSVSDQALRPIVIRMGPCGLFAGLILAQMGLR